MRSARVRAAHDMGNVISRSLYRVYCARASDTVANRMSSSDNGFLSISYADPDPIHSSDFECSSESMYIDTISEQFLPSSSEGECVPDSAQLSSASSRELHSTPSVTAAPVEAPQKIEAKPQLPAKQRRLRMLDQDADGVRITNHPMCEGTIPSADGGNQGAGRRFLCTQPSTSQPQETFLPYAQASTACDEAVRSRFKRVKVSPLPGVCVSSLQGHVALMSYHMQRSCGHEWEARIDHSRVHAESRSWVTSVAAWGLLRISEWMHSCSDQCAHDSHVHVSSACCLLLSLETGRS